MAFSCLRIWIVVFWVFHCSPAWGKVIKIPTDYSTIGKGIDAAEAGDRIIVAPGRYNEQIVMKEGIVLKSDPSDNGDDPVAGPGRKKVLRRALRTIIDGTGFPAFTGADPMVEFPAGITRATVLDGFTITRMPEVDHTLPGHAHTLQCRGSSPVIKNNIVIDNGSSGIGSHGRFKEGQNMLPEEKFSFENVDSHAYPLIENNVFADNIGAGIGNNHYSYATVRNNEVFGSISKHNHPAPGIGIQHGAHPLVEGNLVYNNDWTGIGCRQGSQPVNRRTRPVIRYNTVTNNGLSGDEKHAAGIGADGVGSADAPVTIQNNVVGENQAGGIGIRNGSFAVIAGNISYGNGWAGIGMDKSSALVKDNTVYNNKRAGIGCRGCQATIENNETYENRQAGIGLEKAGGMIIVGNRIHHNGVSGFWGRIKNFFTSLFDIRTLSRGGAGIGMKESEILIFNNNTINNNTLPGLAVTEGSLIKKGEKNLIEKNGTAWAPNLVLLNRSQVTLLDTAILEGNPVNIYLSGSRATLGNCRVEKAWKPGIVAENGSTLKIAGGRISDNGAVGVLLEGSQGDIQGVLISGNAHHGIEVQEKSSLRMENCTLQNNSDHGGAGISIEQSDAYLLRNLIHHNKNLGVEADSGNLVLWNNVLADQEQGAEIEGKSVLDARNNVFANNRSYALEMDKTVAVKHLSHNVFFNNGGLAGKRPNFLNFLPKPSKEEKEYENWKGASANLAANPGFTDSAAGDYRLQENSPLIDAGEDLGLPFNGKAPDIGAIEYDR